MDGRRRQPRRLGPPRFGADQLGWVVRNRQARSTGRLVGQDLPAAEVEQGGNAGAAREVFEAINRCVDDTFRMTCTFDDARGGTVRILVKRPELLYHIRMKWQALLLQTLKPVCRRGAVRKIVFVPVSGEDADRPEFAGVRFPGI